MLLMIALLLGGVFVAFFGSVFIFTQPITEAGSTFLSALRAEDYPGAYRLLTGDFQERVDSPTGLRTLITEADAMPVIWSVNFRQIINSVAELGGNLTTTSGVQHSVRLQLRREDGEWRVADYSLLEADGAGSN
ncbi:MAG: hypothetical protein SF029_17805 [bacterium]|nr:hypothetical protein [bacterium]